MIGLQHGAHDRAFYIVGMAIGPAIGRVGGLPTGIGGDMGNDRVEKLLGNLLEGTTPADAHGGGVTGGKLASGRRRWLVLALAAIAGFVGSGVAMSSGTILRLFVALFFAVFLLALAFSIVMEPAPVDPLFEPEERGPSYAEAPQVGHEAVYGSS